MNKNAINIQNTVQSRLHKRTKRIKKKKIVEDALTTGSSDHKRYSNWTQMGTAIIQGLIRKYKGVNKKSITKTVKNMIMPVRGQAIKLQHNRFKIGAKINEWFNLPKWVKVDKNRLLRNNKRNHQYNHNCKRTTNTKQ